MRLWRARAGVPAEADVEQLFAKQQLDRLWIYAVNSPATKAVPVLRRLGALNRRPGSSELAELARACPDEIPVGLSFTAHTRIECGESYATIDSVVISPDGVTLATGAPIAPPRLWRLPGGEPVARLHDMGATHLAFSPDGRFLAGIAKPERGPREGVMVWELPAGRRVHYFDFPGVHALALDNNRVVGASRTGEVSVWDLSGGEQLMTRSVSRLGADLPVFSPDGSFLAVTAGNGTIFDGPSTTEVWRWPAGQPMVTIDSPQVTALTVLDNGLIAGACEGSVRLWRPETGELVGTLEGDQQAIWQLSARGAALVAGGFDRTFRIWDVSTRQALAVRRQGERVVHVATTEGMAVSGNLAGTLTWYELPAAASTARTGRRVESLAATPALTVSGHNDGTAVIWQPTLRRAAAATELDFADRLALEARAPDATGAERGWIDLVLALDKERPH